MYYQSSIQYIKTLSVSQSLSIWQPEQQAALCPSRCTSTRCSSVGRASVDIACESEVPPAMQSTANARYLSALTAAPVALATQMAQGRNEPMGCSVPCSRNAAIWIWTATGTEKRCCHCCLPGLPSPPESRSVAPPDPHPCHRHRRCQRHRPQGNNCRNSPHPAIAGLSYHMILMMKRAMSPSQCQSHRSRSRCRCRGPRAAAEALAGCRQRERRMSLPVAVDVVTLSALLSQSLPPQPPLLVPSPE